MVQKVSHQPSYCIFRIFFIDTVNSKCAVKWSSFFTARCYAERGYATVSRLSVCPSVTLRYIFHTGWNTSKIISRPNSLRPLLWLTPTWAIWCNGNTPKIRVEHGRGHSGAQKTAISPKGCKIGPRLLLRTNRKSYTRFRLVPKSTTLNVGIHECSRECYPQ